MKKIIMAICTIFIMFGLISCRADPSKTPPGKLTLISGEEISCSHLTIYTTFGGGIAEFYCDDAIYTPRAVLSFAGGEYS